jgi:multisubunit Na+/H+ antiporter MnhB subunit
MVSTCNMEIYCYIEGMDHDITAHAAVRTAEAARTAAAARATPTWFPAVTGALFAACLTGVGSAQLIGWHHVAAKITGLGGTACGIAFGLMYVLLIAGWMRRGVIPLGPTCDRSRRQLRDRDLWIVAGILAASAAAWAATGHLGWAVIVFGITEGVHHWRRILPGLFGTPRP